jgi:uncharacterized protein YdhG (YjbR/CyaY superfamily)
MEKAENVTQYIAGFPLEIQPILEQMRGIIRTAAPEAAEVISYGMPAYKLNGILVYFAAQKNHLGFYPTGSGIKAFQNVLGAMHTSKGTIRFPFNEPLPADLISDIVKYRVGENLGKKKPR